MIFALSPQAKGRVERAAGTFPHTGWYSELRLAGASTIDTGPTTCWRSSCPGSTNASRYRRSTPETAFRPLVSGAVPGTGPVFQAQFRKVARVINTVRFQLHTLQFVCSSERIVPATPERWWRSWSALDGRLAVRREGRMYPCHRTRRPLRYFSEMAAGHSTTRLYLISAPVPWQKAGARLLRHWTRWQMTPKTMSLS